MKKSSTPEILRYNYSAALAAGESYVGPGEWLDLMTVRKCVAAMIRDPRYLSSSVEVTSQRKKSAWAHQQSGSVADIFPDIWLEWTRETAVNRYLATVVWI
jgi:hypothetical protein